MALRSSIPILLTLLTGCGEWPRHAHLPDGDSEAISTGDNPATGVQIDWTALQLESEPNDLPGRPEMVGLGEGLQIEGELSGSGWDPNAEPARWSDCGGPLAFPPAHPGDYSADVDWVTVETSEAGTLCASVTLEDRDLSFDLTVYVLDACREPIEIFVDDSGPLGVERTGGRWSVAVTVPEGLQIGIALASYRPEDPDTKVPWRLTTALVPPLTDVDLCPVRP